MTRQTTAEPSEPLSAASPSALTMQAYAVEQSRGGTRVVRGRKRGTFWFGYEAAAMMKLPLIELAPPSSSEVRSVLRRTRKAVATYLREPDEAHPANAWFYVCCDPNYSLDKLPESARRAARRARRDLVIAEMTWPDLLAHGFEAYRETRARVGLSDGTREAFERRFGAFSKSAAHRVFGAWKGESLLSFMTLVAVDDWAEIEGSFSRDAERESRPSDGLANCILEHFLVECGFRSVDYGVSSIQEESNEEGLHRFKEKVGFEARPVHRAFVVHPLLRPFVNRATLAAARALLKRRPGQRSLKKAAGLLADLVEPRRALPQENNHAGTKL